MRKSIGDNMIPTGWSLERGLELVKKAGFDGIELWLGDVPWFQMATTDAEVGELRRRVENAGLVVSNVSTGLHWASPVTLASGPILDKDWITCDNGASSPFSGRCYLSYSDIERSRLATQTSTDGGRTWSEPVASPDDAGHRGILGAYAPRSHRVVDLAGCAVDEPPLDDVASALAAAASALLPSPRESLRRPPPVRRASRAAVCNVAPVFAR